MYPQRAEVIFRFFAVFPSEFILPSLSRSINGSSATGQCSSVNVSNDTSTCLDPTSSVLFDRITPTLTGLDGNMWASQLLTTEVSSGRSATLTINFTATLGYVGVRRLEIAMFNCPEWGIAPDTILVRESQTQRTIGTVNIDANMTSCDSLVKLCLPHIWSVKPVLDLQFIGLDSETRRVSIAEVSFFGAGEECPMGSNGVMTTPPPSPPEEERLTAATISITTGRRKCTGTQTSHMLKQTQQLFRLY